MSEIRKVQISVVVATRNRAESLREALRSLAEQSLDHSLFEVVVVDNCLTDDTERIIHEFQRQVRHPWVRYLRQKVTGLNAARELAFQNCVGAYVAFMHDDAVASEKWLENAMLAFRNVRPTPDGVGGPVLPRYKAPRPPWFKHVYAIKSWGLRSRFLNRGESFSGANMIFQKKAILKCGGFGGHCGWMKQMLPADHDRAFYQRVWAQDGHANLYYSPQVIVYHQTHGFMMSLPYQLRRAFEMGRSSYVLRACTKGDDGLAVLPETLCSVFRKSWSAFRRWTTFASPRHWIVEMGAPLVHDIGVLAAALGFLPKTR